jgi:hypothetical protein
MATLQRTGITGSLNISGSGASGSIVLNITGSTGTLFIVDDVNSGSLFNVNNAIGLPVLEAFSDGVVNIGKYGSEGVKVYSNGNVSIANGALIVSSSGFSPFKNDTWVTTPDTVNRFYFTTNGDTELGSKTNFSFYSNGNVLAKINDDVSNGDTNNLVTFGVNAGSGVTQALNSNFFGNQAGGNNYYAIACNFFGYQAGYSNYNNYSYNVNNSNFFGNQAGMAQVNYNHAYNSNFFGYQAGYSNYNNVGTKNYAHDSNFFGYQAGCNDSNVNDNYAYNSNFFGYRAGYNAYQANNSNFFGTSAGNSATNANGSNFIGVNAGYLAINAKNSIFIGYNAGYYDAVNNTGGGGHSSILIGDYTNTNGFSDSISIGRATGNSAARQVNVGNVLWINGIQTGSSSVTSSITTAKIGIGTNKPVNTLDVVGNISASAITASTIILSGLLNQQATHCVLGLTASVNVGNADVILPVTAKSDPNNWYNSTSSSIKPTAAGYYYVSAMVKMGAGTSGSGNQQNIQIHKTSGATVAIAQDTVDGFNVGKTLNVYTITYMNGSTDIVYLTGYSSNTVTVTGEGAQQYTQFMAYKIS